MLWGGSRIRFALANLPAGAELRFTPRLHPDSRTGGVAADFAVTLESGQGGERELWRRTLGPRDAEP